MSSNVHERFQVAFDKALQESSIPTLIDQIVRQELKLEPDEDVSDNDLYWCKYTLTESMLFARWVSKRYVIESSS